MKRVKSTVSMAIETFGIEGGILLFCLYMRVKIRISVTFDDLESEENVRSKIT